MKYLSRTLILLLALLVVQGCSDLLDNPQPDTSVSQQIALTNEGAVESVRAGMYGYLHSFTYTTEMMLAPDALADNFTNSVGSSRFAGYANNATGAGMSSWGTAYDLINQSNLLIHAIEEGVVDDNTLAMYRGEGYFFRAFAMHHLARAISYEPGQFVNGWDRGIIMRTKPTLDVTDADFRARATVGEVYTQIKADLQEAINLLGTQQENNRYHVQQAAAYALLARVQLYEGSWADAASSAQSAMDATGASLATSESAVVNMFDEGTGINPEGILITLVDPSTESQGANSALHAYTADLWVAQIPTQDAIDLYDASDWRNGWFAPCFNDRDNASVDCSPGAGLEIQKWNGEKGQYADDVPLFRIAEMLLIKAEGELKSGNTAGALTALNKLRNARGIGDFVSTDTDAIMNEILDERRRELIGEGHRFFDLKRLGMDIRKAPGVPASTVPYNSFKVLDNLPEDEVELNSKLEQNPGY